MNLRGIAGIVVVVIAVGAAGAGAESHAGDAAVAAVVKLEETRRAAMVSVDRRGLEELFDTGATYIHSTGLLQSRGDMLDMLTSGDVRYVAFAVDTVSYHAYGSTVVGTGVQSIDLEVSGKALVSRSRYTVVYVASGGRYRLVAYQSTPLPEGRK
jgi:hypothetical protein